MIAHYGDIRIIQGFPGRWGGGGGGGKRVAKEICSVS